MTSWATPVSSGPSQPDLTAGSSDFTAQGWTVLPAASLAADRSVPDTEPADRVLARQPSATTPPPGPVRSNATALVLLAVLLQAVAAACALAGSALLWQVQQHTRPLAGLPVVSEVSSILLLLTFVAGGVGVLLVALIWCLWRRRPWARTASMLLMTLCALPGLILGILPGVAMILAVVLLARADVRDLLADRVRGRDLVLSRA